MISGILSVLAAMLTGCAVVMLVLTVRAVRFSMNPFFHGKIKELAEREALGRAQWLVKLSFASAVVWALAILVKGL